MQDSLQQESTAMEPGKRPFRALPLYLAFTATGVGVALPGVILPVLLAQWQLRDEQGGTLLFLSWFGSSIAGLLIRRSLRGTLAVGCMMIAAGSAGLAELSLRQFPWLMAIFGLGLGLTMTSISLLRQQHTLHQQPAQRDRELIRLNLMWALGAFACPSLAFRVLQSGNMRPLLLGFGLSFLLLGCWVLTRENRQLEQHKQVSGKRQRPWDLFTAVPLTLLTMIFLITGVEAATGGWLSTYASRANRELAMTVAAPTCFWAGLLSSRMLWSLPGMKLSGWQLTLSQVTIMTVSGIVLVLSGGGLLMLIAAFGVGFGLGPIFPLLIAEALQYRESGAAFFISGLGASALPWLTGALSQRRNSLRYGLLAPMAASLLTLALALIYRRKAPPESRSQLS